MRKLALGALLVLMSTPSVAIELGYDEVRTIYVNPSVRLDDGEFYPVHRGDGRDYCRGHGYRNGNEVRTGEYVDDGLARHKGGRWQYTTDGPTVARLRCY